MILDVWQRECLEQQQLTATTLQREYQNGYFAGQKKAYDECDEAVRELSQIKSGCSKWLDEHDKEIEIKTITKCMDLVRDVIVDLDCVNSTKYGNKNAKQQENSYSTIMRYEIADELDSLLDWMENLKRE